MYKLTSFIPSQGSILWCPVSGNILVQLALILVIIRQRTLFIVIVFFYQSIINTVTMKYSALLVFALIIFTLGKVNLDN